MEIKSCNSENELLLDKNSSFKITGFDYDKNIIKAEYIGK